MTQTRNFDLVTAGRWHRLRLGTDEEIRTQIRAYMEYAGQQRDDQVLLRADLRRRMFEQAVAARDAGGSHQYLCIELMPGVPLPASFTVVWPLLRFEHGGEPDAEEFGAWTERLGDGLAATEPVELADGMAIGRHAISRGPALGIDGMTEMDVLRADYWVTLPDTADELVLFSFNCPVVADPKFILGLFTVMLASLTWPED